ncbi:MAG: AbrB/MazE/SpoVT family DNA-binding domain-containing protein [Gammaproteobacteria bacterium]|nr:AbrB/MazE/SpoVT family DNA-binding domain-containing protein [Gammaproteobacteria bacterium]MCP5409143.1 AbrB/MazE/SpoVT family DNA-binding domain-containing protein [Chromatiaceae bacterium]
MATATLSSKSQLVLPAEIRRKLGIQPGDRLIVELEGDHAVVRKAPHSDVEELAAYRSAVWRDYADELQEARDEWDR